MTNFNSDRMIFGCEIRIETQLLEDAKLVLEVGFLVLLKPIVLCIFVKEN